ncbi:hypothetical protein PANDA_020714 [Ailuropoda melanoleuca]|uniref:Uncharacterized protein n=1 Tax=Ailuropoda melanoleuca TaxID=9646 RepID=D2I502_AILME|nr:hypothetical protein PANDA_020714 [Ailuropoda melanoleuca]
MVPAYRANGKRKKDSKDGSLNTKTQKCKFEHNRRNPQEYLLKVHTGAQARSNDSGHPGVVKKSKCLTSSPKSFSPAAVEGLPHQALAATQASTREPGGSEPWSPRRGLPEGRRRGSFGGSDPGTSAPSADREAGTVLGILCTKAEGRLRPLGLRHRGRVVSVSEDFCPEAMLPEQGRMDRQEMLLEELAPVGPAHVPPNIHLESPALQVMAPAPEALVAEAWIPQAGLPELGYGAAGDCQPFLDPGKRPRPKTDPGCPAEHREELQCKELQDSKEVEEQF